MRVRVAAVILVGCGLACGGNDEADDGDYEAFRENCERLASEQECVEQEPLVVHEGGLVYSCTWARWVPVVHDSATGSCEFGAVQAKCEINQSADVCYGAVPDTCTEVDNLAVRKQEAGELFLAKAQFCDGAACTHDGNAWNYPECACACDPAYP